MNRLAISAAIVLVVVVAMPSCRPISGDQSTSGEPMASHDPVPSSPITPGPSVYPEVIWYAEEFGVSLEEAIRRTEIMVEFDTTPLREAVGDRWAGGWLEHEPEFRFVVRLTGEGTAEFEALTADWPLPVGFITGADFTESDALAGLERIDDVLHAEFPNMGFGWQPMEGAIVMNGPDEPSAEFMAELEALAGVPVLYEYSPPAQLHGG